MVRLSVNVNKVATLRNSRGGALPRVTDAVAVCVSSGVAGITVHPRGDKRHITPDDVREVAAILAHHKPHVEFNIEGDPRPDLIALVEEVQPDQCTLVPVAPGEITSQAGWSSTTAGDEMRRIVGDLQGAGVRVSLFVDPEIAAVEWAERMKADRVELYTEPYARAFESGADSLKQSFEQYTKAANRAHQLGLGVNAGHDLDLENLDLFRTLPYLDEVSIGHALISRALFVGLKTVVKEYLEVLSQ